MVSPAFGWSAGDIISSIRIIIKICEAFKEVGGATSRYKECTAFLEGLRLTLSKLELHIRRSPNPEYAAEISELLKLIDAPYCRFEKFMLDFQPALSPTSNHGSIRKVPKKIKWALKELSAVSGKVDELKREVCYPLTLLENLMQRHVIDILQKIAEQVSKLPESAQIETMMNAQQDTAQKTLIEIQKHIHDLNRSAQGHEKKLAGLADFVATWETSLLTYAIEESEKSRQVTTKESVEVIKHVDNFGAILEKKLAAITDVLEEQERSRFQRHENLVEDARSHQFGIDQVHRSVETFAVKIVDTMAPSDQKMTKAENYNECNPGKMWLGQCATQVISNGITSAFTRAIPSVSMTMIKCTLKLR